MMSKPSFQQHLNRRMMSESGWLYFCRQCGTYVPEEQFYKKKDSTWGLDSKCKNHGQKDNIPTDPEMDYLKLNPIQESDFVGTQKLLEGLGYCFGCGKSVHQQFMEKHFGKKI